MLATLIGDIDARILGDPGGDVEFMLQFALLACLEALKLLRLDMSREIFIPSSPSNPPSTLPSPSANL